MMQDARETEYAWRLHEAGFSIFPVGSPALAGSRTGKPLVDYCKRPLVEWKGYQNTPPSDAMIAQWLQQYKGCNWGICTGRKVNVVDADSDQAVAKIEARDWITFSPFYVTTGNGRHYLYSTADGEAGVIKNSVGSATKIDTRGYGGFIVAPGSIHGTGVVYEFHAPEGKEIGDVFHDAPPLTMEDMRKIQTFHPDGENEKPSASNTGVDEGGRNNNLAAMAGKWIREDMPFHEVIGRAIALNDLNNPPLPENEVRRTVASVMQTHLMRPENDFVAVHETQKLTASALDLMRSRSIRSMKIEAEDYCFQDSAESGLFSTKDFVQVYGGTGGSKTLVSVSMAAAIASGAAWLDWPTKKPRKVLYLDGELADITIQKRLNLAARDMTSEQVAKMDENLFVFNRDIMFAKLGIDLKPLDTPEGHRQIIELCDLIGAEAVFFDSRFCLLMADMKDSESMPKRLNLELRNRSILQVWIHHSGKVVESGGYGDKTAEFLMDSNISLSPYLDDNEKQIGVEMVFQKKRKEEPMNEHFYATKVIQLVSGTWQYVDGAEPKSERKRGRPAQSSSMTAMLKDDIKKRIAEIDAARRNAGYEGGIIPRDRLYGECRDKSGIFADGDNEENFKKMFSRCLKQMEQDGKFETDRKNITVKKTSVFDAIR